MSQRDPLQRVAAQKKALREVRTACEADADTLQAAGRDTRELGPIHTLAGDILDDFVLRFGMVGDSGAGKSRLIGGLIGRADALPANPFPETGNIAVLRVTSSDNATATTLNSYRLNFLSAEDAGTCLRLLLISTLDEFQRVAAHNAVEENGRQLLNGDTGVDAEAVEKWLREAWTVLPDPDTNAAGERSGAVDVRSRLLELTRFALAWNRFGAIVAGRNNEEVNRDVARSAMVLPRASDASSLEEIVTGVSRAAEGAGLPSDATAAFSGGLTVELGKALYPLIRDVRIDVVVPTAIWNLSDLNVDAIELWDFPGFGAQGTSARDELLSQRARESDRIHTWVVAVNSSNLLGSQATVITQNLRKERVIAIASRFDELPMKEGWFQELCKLAEPDAPPRDQKTLVRHLEPLGPLVSLLPDLTSEERCAFVSAMTGAFDLDRTPAGNGKVFTNDEREEWAPDIERNRRIVKLWRQLAAKLKECDPLSPLCRWLKEYTRENGQSGLVHLRRILTKHVNASGVELLADERERAIAPLRKQIGSLLDRLDAEEQVSKTEADDIRANLDRLVDVLREQEIGGLDELDVLPSALSEHAESLPTLRTEIRSFGEATRLIDLIRGELMMRVFDWEEWKLLLDSVGPNGFVEVKKEVAPASPYPWDDPEEPVENASTPVGADQLYEPFRRTFGELQAIAAAGLRACLVARLEPMRNSLQRLARSFGRTGSLKGPIPYALSLSDPAQVRTSLVRDVIPEGDLPPEADPFWRKCFPFIVAFGDEGELAPGPYFGWADERLNNVGNRVLNTTQHQIYIFRLRYELCRAMETAIRRQLNDGLHVFSRGLRDLQGKVENKSSSLKDESNHNLLATFGRTQAGQEQSTLDLRLRHVRLP